MMLYYVYMICKKYIWRDDPGAGSRAKGQGSSMIQSLGLRVHHGGSSERQSNVAPPKSSI